MIMLHNWMLKSKKMNKEKNQKMLENWLSSKVENSDKVKQSVEVKEKLNNWLNTKVNK